MKLKAIVNTKTELEEGSMLLDMSLFVDEKEYGGMLAVVDGEIEPQDDSELSVYVDGLLDDLDNSYYDIVNDFLSLVAESDENEVEIDLTEK